MERRPRLNYSPDPLKCPRGEITFADGTQAEVRLRDLSAFGAGFICETPVATEQTVVFSFTNSGATTHVPALVRWSGQRDYKTWAVGCQFVLEGGTSFPVDHGTEVDEGSGLTRIPVNIPTTAYALDKRDVVYDATIVNYSDEGLCLSVDGHVPAGELVRVRLPGRDEYAAVRVQWHRSCEGGWMHGCAFRNEEDAVDCFDAIQDHVAELRSQQKPTVLSGRIPAGVLAGSVLVVGWCYLYVSGAWNLVLDTVKSFVG